MNLKNNPEMFVLEAFYPYRLSLLSNTVSQGIANAYRKSHGLSVTEWRVIAILGRFPGLTASEVMQQGAMDKVTVSRAVTRLCEKKLVKRHDDQDDRRRKVLRLTNAKGTQVFSEVVPQAVGYEQQLLAALSGEEQQSLDKLLSKLQKAAGQLNLEEE